MAAVNDVNSRLEVPHSRLVQVWVLFLPDVRAGLDSLRGFLSPEESRRAARFVFEGDRQRFVSTRGVLRLLLARYLKREPDRIVFRYGPHGKPALVGEPGGSPDLRFNVSHSGDYCLCAVTVGREVGVDVELVRPDVECLQLAERFFTRREYEDLLQQPEEARPARFFRYWTSKEAYLKTQGVGISSGMARLEMRFHEDGSVECCTEDGAPASEPHYLVRSIPIAGNVVAAVAAEGNDWEVALSHYSVK